MRSWINNSEIAFAGILVAACGTQDPRQMLDAGTADTGRTTQPDGGTDLSNDATAPYFPFKVGNSWTYRVTDPATQVMSMKTNIVERMEKVDGTGPNAAKIALVVKTIKTETRSGRLRTDWVVSWQGFEGTALVRYREQGYTPVFGDLSPSRITYEAWWDKWQMRFDESTDHTKVDATWTEGYDEFQQPTGFAAGSTNETDVWKVEAIDDACSVPNKPAMVCLRIRKSGTTADAGKAYWFARGVGKVKETGVPLTGQIEDLMDFTITP